MSGIKRSRSDTAGMKEEGSSSTTKRVRVNALKSSNANKKSTLRKLILEAAKNTPNGISFQQVCTSVPSEVSPDEIVQMLNTLCGKKRLSLFKNKKGEFLWKWIDEVQVKKFRGLTSDQMMIYEEIKKSGNMGLTKKEIRNKTNFLTNEITKLTSILMKKDLIKLIHVVPSKTRKVYMLTEIEPSSSVTGGPWYNDELEYDLEFITVLYQHVLEYIKKQSFVSVKDVADFVRKRAISNEELSEKDIESLLNTMVFDGFVEYCNGSENGTALFYRLALPMPSVNSMSEVPCGVCPVRKECKPGGAISPTNCKYMKDWLATVNDW